VTFNHSLIGTAENPKDSHVLRTGTPLVSSDDKEFYEKKIPQVVAATLEVQLAPSRARGTSSEEAFDLYRQGLGVLYNFDNPQSLDEAIKLFSEAVQEDPDYAAAHAALGEAYFYKFDRNQNRAVLSQSLEACQRAETLASDSSGTQVCLGRVYAKMGQMPLAEQTLSAAIKYSATNDEPQRLLGKVYEDQGFFDQAEKHYLEAISLRGDWHSYSWIAGFYSHKRRDFKRAEENYKLALIRSPGGTNARVLYSLGGVFGMAGDYVRAIDSLKESDKLVPNQPRTLSNLGMTYWQSGDIDSAISALERATQIIEREGGDNAAVGNLARVYLNSGQTDKALDTYKRAISVAEKQLEIDPYKPEIHILLGRYYAALDNFQKAKASIDLALYNPTRDRSKDPHYLLIAATAYARLRDKSRALDYIESAAINGARPAEILAEPELNVLKDEPRYKNLTRP
jgi:tetratricopeptide (TPR) repeat protein